MSESDDGRVLRDHRDTIRRDRVDISEPLAPSVRICVLGRVSGNCQQGGSADNRQNQKSRNTQ